MTDLISTLESPSEFDALSKLRPDEPFFLLLGRDRLAPPLVQKWADENRERALREFSDGTINEERRNRELRKSTQAEAIGWEMKSYKAGDLAKRALGEPTAKAYSGHELPEETKRSDAIQTARIRAKETIDSAVSALAVLMEALGEPSTADDNPTIKALRELSVEVGPPSRREVLERVRG